MPPSHRSEPLISLVVPTVGRAGELLRLLKSIASNEAFNGRIETLIIDQNSDSRVGNVLREIESDTVFQWYKCPPIGASAARNIGALTANGKIVAFPDDDCWLTPDCLNIAAEHLDRRESISAVSGIAIDRCGRPVLGRWETNPINVDPDRCWTSCIEFATFFRRNAFIDSGGFKVNIGPGSGTRMGGHEINELILRMLYGGRSIDFAPSIAIHHDPPNRRLGSIAKRSYYYGYGKGAVCRSYSNYRGREHMIKSTSRSLGGIVAAISSFDPITSLARTYRIAGQIAGWVAHPLKMGAHETWASNRPLAEDCYPELREIN